MTRLSKIDQEPRIGRFLHDLVNERQYADFFPLDDAADLERSKLIFPPEPDPGIGPFGQYMLNPSFRRYHTDSIAAYMFDDVYVIGGDGVVVMGGGVLRNTLDYISHWMPESNAADFRRSEYLRLRREMPVTEFVEDGRYVIGFSGAWRNHGHWLPQCLPKLYAFSLLRRRFRDLKVVLPPLAPGSAQQRTLDLLGIGPEAVYTLPVDSVTGFASAIVLPSFDIWSVAPFVSHAADKLIAGVPPAAADAPKRPERVYVHRTVKARPVANFEAVRDVVEKHGFSIVSFEGTDLAEQIATMQAARVVISEHGAGTTNILFCREGARVLEMFNSFCVQPAFWSIASRRGLEYGYLTGRHVSTKERPEPDWNSAYEVDLATLEAGIRVLLNQGAPAAQAPAAQAPAAAPPQEAPVKPAAIAAAPVTARAPMPADSIVPAAIPSGGLASFSGVMEPIFDLTADIGSFARTGIHQRIMLFAAATPPAQTPIHRQDGIRPDFVAEHMHYPAPAGVHAYAVTNAVLWGNGLLTSGSQFIAPVDCIPAYFRPHMKPGGQPIHPLHAGSLNRPDPEPLDFDFPVACALHPNIVYGHFLLEMLPRLYVLSILRQFGADFPLLLSTTLAPWVKAFIRLIHPEDRVIWYDAGKHRITAPAIVLPSMMHTDHNFHPAFNLMINDLVRAQLAAPDHKPGPERIYLSRANFGDDRIENEAEVAEVMTAHGFTVVRPHEMTPDAQIRLFAGAKVVAGEYGSSLHNAIFAPHGTTVIALNFFNNYQSKIARLRGHRMAFVPPEGGVFRHWRLTGNLPRRFMVDLAELKQTLQDVLR